MASTCDGIHNKKNRVFKLQEVYYKTHRAPQWPSLEPMKPTFTTGLRRRGGTRHAAAPESIPAQKQHPSERERNSGEQIREQELELRSLLRWC
jgi:hypothetical protein